MQKVKFWEMSEQDYEANRKGECTVEEFGEYYDIADYYADRADVRLDEVDKWGNETTYTYTTDEGEKWYVIAETEHPAQNWEFNNGISVASNPRDLTFDVYYDDDYLGCIGCDTQKDFIACVYQLDDGKDPVSAGWDDGAMNGCDIIGWGENEKELTKRQETALRKEFGARKKGLKKWWFD